MPDRKEAQTSLQSIVSEIVTDRADSTQIAIAINPDVYVVTVPGKRVMKSDT